MPKSRLELLQSIPFFSSLTASELEGLAALSLVHEFPPHVVLQAQNTVPDSLFCLLDGSVEIVARSRRAGSP